MANLLTYGSLMFNDVWEKLVKGEYHSRKATLNGYARRCVLNDVYPVIFPADESVQGVVYFDIIDEDMKILDEFEGIFYERRSLEALLEDHQSIPIEVYVLKEQYFNIIDHKLWDEAFFAQEGIKQFIKNYKGFI
ncbi:MAG: gamma-glutamylcyclotransferase [Sulfurospirillaceae bacterium]|nr:gamma-glutamylcyclotransferase [Sulfurospirillaceae bacterium]